jgi:hypothetical protein
MKMEFTSDNGKIHAVVENPEGLKEMGIDVVEETKTLLQQQEQMEKTRCVEELKSINEDLIFIGDTPEQYADAIIGVTYDGNHIIYSVERFQECLMREGMTHEEAEDWTSYNTARSLPYMGELAPILMNEISR